MIKSHIFKDKHGVAEAFANYLNRTINKSRQFNIALSGGSTPKILFNYLAKQYTNTIEWEKVHIYWGDERCVPPDHEESNYGMTVDKLLQHIDIPEENIHRVKGENDPQQEAIRYGNLIQRQVPQRNGRPIFDLVLLGMGSDGHTASIFPHQMSLLHSEKTCEVAIHPETGQKRITITGNIINSAKQAHFLVTGESKSEVVQEIFNKKGDYKSYPAAHIEKAEWWLDKAAV